jgi:hypothetical protein
VKSYRIPYNQLVSILADQKDRLAEDHIASPFDNADDRLMSVAAGEYLKLYVLNQQRYRHGRITDAFTKLLGIIGYPVKKMKLNDVDNLIVDMDDFALRMSSFADYLLSELEARLAWSTCTVNVDESLEEVIITLGRDHRVNRYYELIKEKGQSQRLPLVSMPRSIEEVDDLEDVEHQFQAFVNCVFDQVESDAVRGELKKKFIDYISEKN